MPGTYDHAVKFVSWNVNSLKARWPRLVELLALHRPDVVCLQETKLEPAAFPAEELEAVGYTAVHHSAGRWAGVALLARRPLAVEDPVAGLAGEAVPAEARWVEGTIGELRIASVYVPNGRLVGSETFAQKLVFLDAIAARLPALDVVLGDFNVAPADLDVYDPAAFAGATHVTPAERDRLSALTAGAGCDAFRLLHPDEPGFTWWDYRQGHFHRGLGLRIDLALVAGPLRERVSACGIDRDFRKGPRPSDHAPLLLELAG
ncbi:MAG: exodeoxyribonuclease III [Solirubrobacteraceae bacterium]